MPYGHPLHMCDNLRSFGANMIDSNPSQPTAEAVDLLEKLKKANEAIAELQQAYQVITKSDRRNKYLNNASLDLHLFGIWAIDRYMEVKSCED